VLFNSKEFLIFFPLVVLLYYALPPRRRWWLLLPASYAFYMSWRPTYLALILLSTTIVYFVGRAMAATDSQTRRKTLLILSLVGNLGLLFAFKYFNFFNDNLGALLDGLGLGYAYAGLSVALPVGISFYTFQALGYNIDVYRGEVQAEKRFGKLALFVAFFPQLVAGPIERTKRLLPQFDRIVRFDQAQVLDGLKLMTWGLFKKVVVADRLAMFVNAVFADPAAGDSLQLLAAAYFFSFQIYCDFSGYTDIARGAARVLGFELTLNFRRPFHADSIRDFWRRWHITLSTWFRDYLYIPLGGGRVRARRLYFNLAVVFLLSGLWHGAAWTFVVWGALHGTLLIVSHLSSGWRQRLVEKVGLMRRPLLHRWWRIFVTFHLVVGAFVVFRAASLADAWRVFAGIGRLQLSPGSLNAVVGSWNFLLAIFWVIALEIVETLHDRFDLRRVLARRGVVVRYLAYLALVLVILLFGVFEEVEFIYFQF